MSLPSRERGLKSGLGASSLPQGRVAPFTGAWIEMAVIKYLNNRLDVAPFTGAWIEMI